MKKTKNQKVKTKVDGKIKPFIIIKDINTPKIREKGSKIRVQRAWTKTRIQ